MTSSLPAGSTIARYRIDSFLGAGGMGEVYKAFDTTLERYVAIKILAEDLVKDSDRLRRFEQEAKTASALHHPTIVTIHEIGSVDVRLETNQHRRLHYISMELVEGQTLRRRMNGSPRDLRRLLPLMAQATDGIARAHSSGIIHRDLKPENIMVAEQGFAKVLDFGLAKLIEVPGDPGPSSAGGDSNTQSGMILGTVGYMSPEQLRGDPVDFRTDIFAVGCILYEIATGMRPFRGRSSIETMHQTLNQDPAPPVTLNPSVPAELQRIIRKCMAKEPDDRYQSMKDLSIDLRTLSHDMATGEIPGMAIERNRSTRVLLISALVIALIGLTALALSMRERRTASASGPPDLEPFQKMELARLTTDRNATTATVTPDGKYLVYAVRVDGKESLMVNQIATGSSVQIVPPVQGEFGTLLTSPDGQHIYYVLAERPNFNLRTIYQVPLLGGRPRKIVADLDSDIDLSPDGKQLAFTRLDAATRVSTVMIADTERQASTEVMKFNYPSILSSAICWSPDGTLLAVAVRNMSRRQETSVGLIDIARKTIRTASTHRWLRVEDLAWPARGEGLIMTANNRSPAQLILLPLDGTAPRRITNDLGWYSGASVTADGNSVVTVRGEVGSELWLVDVKSGKTRRIPSSGVRQLGRDGMAFTSTNKLVVTAQQRDTELDLWMIDPQGTDMRQLTRNARGNFQPAVSKDDSKIAFVSDRDARGFLWVMDADGSNARAVTETLTNYPSFSSDGQWIVANSYGPDQLLRKFPVAGGQPVELSTNPTNFPRLSPDGRLILCRYRDVSSGKPVFRTALLPYEGGQPLKFFEVPAVYESLKIAWTESSDRFAFVGDEKGVSNLWEQSLSGAPPRQVTNFDSGKIYAFAYSRDGRYIAVVRGDFTSDVIRISNFR